MNTCELTGKVVSPSGEGVANAFVRVRLLAGADGNVFATTDGTVSTSVLGAYADEDGAWSFDLPQGARFRIEIPAAGVDHVGTVPDEDDVAFEELLPAMEPYSPAWSVPCF